MFFLTSAVIGYLPSATGIISKSCSVLVFIFKIEISIHKPCSDNCGWLMIEHVTIEKHVDKVTCDHIESNGSADVNRPNHEK